MSYLIYLRKSRADIEAEARGEGETLARHETQLLELAKRRQIPVGDIYREIVSGETLAARPQMQRLIEEVSAGMWDGVLVMEVERLARGDTIDQGIVSQAFTYSRTKIITPAKDYDPLNEADQEYFEFSLFMSRREYKTINRRMQAGRIASLKEGNYIATFAPYGYKKVHDYEKRVFTLEPVPEEADAIKLIFEHGAAGEGPGQIAAILNGMGIKPKRGMQWTAATLRDLMSNPVYCGKLRWNWRKQRKKLVDGRITKSRPKSPAEECMVVQGNHIPIISEELFYKTQEAIKARKTPHTISTKSLKNPYAQLMYCGLCGHSMERRPYPDRVTSYLCKYSMCPCMSSDEPVIDDLVLSALNKGYEHYTALASEDNPVKSSGESELALIAAEIKKAEKQQSKLYDLLEQEIYTPEVFTERSKLIAEKLRDLYRRQSELEQESQRPHISPKEAALAIRNVIDHFGECSSAEEKNKLLKTVCNRITYSKTTGGRWGKSDAMIVISYIF